MNRLLRTIVLPASVLAGLVLFHSCDEQESETGGTAGQTVAGPITYGAALNPVAPLLFGEPITAKMIIDCSDPKIGRALRLAEMMGGHATRPTDSHVCLDPSAVFDDTIWTVADIEQERLWRVISRSERGSIRDLMPELSARFGEVVPIHCSSWSRNKCSAIWTDDAWVAYATGGYRGVDVVIVDLANATTEGLERLAHVRKTHSLGLPDKRPGFADAFGTDTIEYIIHLPVVVPTTEEQTLTVIYSMENLTDQPIDSEPPQIQVVAADGRSFDVVELQQSGADDRGKMLPGSPVTVSGTAEVPLDVVHTSGSPATLVVRFAGREERFLFYDALWAAMPDQYDEVVRKALEKTK